MFAVIRIRGSINTRRCLKDTMKILRLNSVNHCILVPENSVFKGMLKKAQSYITYGEISDNMLEKLVLKRGRLEGNKKLTEKEAVEIAKKILKTQSVKNLKIKHIFRLSPPSKGHKTIKQFYPKGALGYRKDKINELLERMI